MKNGQRVLINNGLVVTQNDSKDIIEDGSIYIVDGIIEKVDKTVNMGYVQADRTIDARGKIVIPGLVNAHTHTGYYMTRGLGMDLDLIDWLKGAIWPWIIAMDEKDAYVASLVGYIECLKSGTTTVFDNQNYPMYNHHLYDAAAQAAVDSKLRVAIAPGFSDYLVASPSDMVNTMDEIYAECKRMISKWHNKGKIKVMLSPINHLFCTREAVEMALKIMRDSDLKMHTHVAESKREHDLFKDRFGMGYIEAFAEIGALNKDFMSVHTIWVSEHEIELIAQNGATVITNPASNMLLASGVAPLTKMLESGVNVALGTDSPNNNNDMFEAMKYANLLQKVSTCDPLAINAQTVFEMATINGARAIGLEDSIGSVEKGKKADLALVDYLQINNAPMHDPISTLVYSARASNVTEVLVDGELLLENGEVTFLDESRLINEVQNRANLIGSRLSGKEA